MRFMLSLLLSVFFFIGGAQAGGSTIYNSKNHNNDGGSAIYNSKSDNSGYGGPLSIKNIIRGKNKNAGRSSSSYSPYNLGGDSNGNGYALSMTPSQVRAKQAQDQARARQRMKENEQRRRAEKSFSSSRYGSDQVKQETNAYTSRFQNEDSSVQPNRSRERAVYSKKRKKSRYVQDKDALVMPEKVFGNIY